MKHQCDYCGENIGWIGKWLFVGLFHTCKNVAEEYIVQVGSIKLTVPEIEKMITWVQKEMKK